MFVLDESVEELNKILLLILGCAVQVMHVNCLKHQIILPCLMPNDFTHQRVRECYHSMG